METATRHVPGYCALCVSRCGCTAVLENGRFTALATLPSHPTGKAICAKGRAAPELVYHPDRLHHPLKRTNPKGSPDPGWQQISWDEALDDTAARVRQIAGQYGPESVAFSSSSPSTTAISDSVPWMERLMKAFGSPNLCASMELCGWGRFLAPLYTYGAPVPGRYMPDIENAATILFWGYNPPTARLSHAVSTTAALRRGAKLIVVDPRKAGLANRANIWLRVRPGTDGALALGIAHLMIENGWYDREFIRDWTNGPLLVRADNGRLLTEADITRDGRPNRYVAWNESLRCPTFYNPKTGRYSGGQDQLALFGSYQINTVDGSEVTCKTAFTLMAEICAENSPEKVNQICGIPPHQLEQTARMLWESRPVAYYAWSGVEMQSNSTQIARAISQLYALTGCLDTPGGNVLFSAVPANPVTGSEFLSPEQAKKCIALYERPLGPGIIQHITSEELYQAILEHEPYPIKGLVGFGANLLLSHSDTLRGREALQALDFYVHTDLFMNPTAELADIVLPAASSFERENLKFGFEVSQHGQSTVQLRPAVVPPQGQSRPDTGIIFDLALRLGLGDKFWNGDVEAAYRHQLEPTGLSLETLREHPEGIQLPLETKYRKYAQETGGVPQGFRTPTRKIELYSETMLQHGYSPLPEYEPPLVSHETRPKLASKYPLILTCTKHTLFCETQHRALPSLRKKELDPPVELHPAAAAERRIQENDWVSIETPHGRVRARARLNDNLEEKVVVGQHGWWQSCDELDAPGYDPFSEEGANFNMIIGRDALDPVSGSVPHRAYICQVSLVE